MPESKGEGWVASWDADGLLRRVDAGMAQGVEQACAHLVRAIKIDLSRPGPRPKPKGSRHPHRPAGMIVGAEVVRPSLPDEPPRQRTGALWSSVAYQKVADMLWRVGTSLKYGFWLEFGTRRGLRPRPWLRPALAREAPRMTQIILNSIKEKLK